MKIIRFLFYILFLQLNAVAVFAQTLFTTNVSANKIARNEVLEISYEIQNGNLENFMQPNFTGWQIVGGPSMSSGTYITNGQKSTSISYQYVLKPLARGVLTLPGAKAVIDGKQVSSNTVKVTVENKDAANPRGSRQSSSLFPFLDEEPAPREDPADNYDGYVLRDGENAAEKTKANLFILVNVNKKTCYEGEPVLATYQLYTRVNLNAHITKRPSFTGFSSIDLPDDLNGEYKIETYKGKQYRVYTIRKVQLYPLLTGAQVLQPAELEATVQFKRVPSAANMSQYDPYSPSNVVNLKYTVKGDPVTINVLPLPEEARPEEFTGTVGAFELKTSLNKSEISRKEAGKLRVEISGQGNWLMVQAPKINWPKGVEVYEPTVTESLDSQSVPVSGKKVYEYSFSSNLPGKMEIPPVAFTFFNPSEKKYKEISGEPLGITVLDKLLPQSSTERGDIKTSPTDITELFTTVVKYLFPIAALILLGWLIVKNNRKRRQKQEERLWEKRFKHNNELERKLAEEKSEPVTAATLVDPPSPVDTSRYQPVFLQNEIAPTPPTFLAESPVMDSSVSSETTGVQSELVLAKDYFTALKKELRYILQWNWQIVEPNALDVKLKLLATGMLAEDAESVTMLIEACDKHIYSPFSEMIDKSEWDEIAREIMGILKKKSR
jgi:hypothetical protein